MNRARKLSSMLLLILWDFFSITASVTLAFKIRYFSIPSNFLYFFYIPPFQREFLFYFVLIAAALLIVLNLFIGCYSVVLRHATLPDLVRPFFSTLAFSAVFFIVNRIFYENLRFYPEVIILMSIILLIFQLIGRAFVRLAVETNAKISRIVRGQNGEKIVRVLIFGAGEAGIFLNNKLKSDRNENMKPVVFIDDDETFKGRKIGNVRVYGGKDKLLEAIIKYEIDEVIVAIPTATREILEYVLTICREAKCQMRRFGNIDDVSLSNATVSNINLEELLRRDSVQLNMQIVRDFVENKVVLVTGGAGSIGSEICRQVLAFGCKKLIIFDIHENGLFDIENELKEKYDSEKIVMRLGSIRDRERIHEVFAENHPELVFHAAAHKHVPMMEYSPREAIKNNVFGTINVAQAAIVHKAHKFILISTDKAVNPTNIMGASKRIAEKAIQLLNTMSDTELAAVRFGNVLGSNGSVVPFFRKQIEAGGPVTVTHPDMRRYFMTIPEAVQLVLEAGAMAAGGEIFVLNMGEPVKIYDLACDLIKLSGYEPDVDIKIVYTGLRPGEKLFEEISMADEDIIKTNNKKIVVLKPISFDETSLAEQIKELERTIPHNNIEVMFSQVQELVPTFNHNRG